MQSPQPGNQLLVGGDRSRACSSSFATTSSRRSRSKAALTPSHALLLLVAMPSGGGKSWPSDQHHSALPWSEQGGTWKKCFGEDCFDHVKWWVCWNQKGRGSNLHSTWDSQTTKPHWECCLCPCWATCLQMGVGDAAVVVALQGAWLKTKGSTTNIHTPVHQIGEGNTIAQQNQFIMQR